MSRKNTHWTDEERDYVIKSYPNHSNEEISIKLGRTEAAIGTMINNLIKHAKSIEKIDSNDRNANIKLRLESEQKTKTKLEVCPGLEEGIFPFVFERVAFYADSIAVYLTRLCLSGNGSMFLGEQYEFRFPDNNLNSKANLKSIAAISGSPAIARNTMERVNEYLENHRPIIKAEINNKTDLDDMWRCSRFSTFVKEDYKLARKDAKRAEDELKKQLKRRKANV